VSCDPEAKRGIPNFHLFIFLDPRSLPPLRAKILENDKRHPPLVTGNKTENSWFTSVTKVNNANQEFIMTKKVTTLALIACLSSSLAFGGEKKKTNSSASDAPTSVENKTNPPGPQTKQKKDQRQSRPATEQEEEFNRVLQGIFG
jgi:hypothetical protein